MAGSLFYDGALTPQDGTFANPGGSTSNSGLHFYDLIQFNVDVSGDYTIEIASPNTAGDPSDALDTYLRLHANTFDPMAPSGAIAANDDFNGLLSVLPGPYAGTVQSSGTGFSGDQPASRLANVGLLAGVDYFLVTTSFRETDFSHAGTVGAQIGAYYTGISGPGEITVVPEPTAILMLAFGAAALIRRRPAQK